MYGVLILIFSSLSHNLGYVGIINKLKFICSMSVHEIMSEWKYSRVTICQETRKVEAFVSEQTIFELFSTACDKREMENSISLLLVKIEKGERIKEVGERRKEKGERRKEKGERRKGKGERRKEKGETRNEKRETRNQVMLTKTSSAKREAF